MDEQLMHGVNAVRRSSENVTRQSIKAIEGIANQTDLLRNVSENLLTQVSGVTNRFEHQGQMIMKAANALETANFRIDKTLQNRQADLSQTLDRLSGKADDVGRAMLGYSESLEGTVTDAESRVRAVGEQMSRGVEERSRLTLSEIERLQAQADSNSDRVLEELKAKFSNVSREVSEQIGSLSSRFSSTSEEMRQRARNTLSELEEEQERLREKLDRLPEATRASAEAMRQSLQEQLKALEQLSSLSSREAARRDISPPAPLPSPSSSQTHHSTSRALTSVTESFTQELSNRTRAAQAPPAPSGAGDGWSLGDLLARASLDEEGGSAHGPLNVQAIARALDATTASAIWSRFRTGQRGIMVRSIYTTDGRAAFDSVQRRYRSELDFQETVDRYMLDFENLLREADTRDASGRAAQGYVTSDSGRVYLFLAHASGRLA